MPNRVSIDMGAGHNLISVEKWLEMPLHSRTRLIMDDKVRFMAGQRIVPIREALKALKAQR